MLEVGKLSGNALVPYSQTTRKTKWVDISSRFVSGTESAAITLCEAQFVVDSSSKISMNLRIIGTKTGNTTGYSLTFSANTFYSPNGAVVARYAAGSISSSGAGITIGDSSLTSGIISISCSSVEVTEIPSWVTPSDWEASTDASIYVEPASVSQAGLVDTNAQSFAGVKTFADGVDVAGVTGGNVIGGTYTPTISGGNNGFSGSASKARWMRVGNIVTVSFQIRAFTTTAAGSTFMSVTVPIACSTDITDDRVSGHITITPGTPTVASSGIVVRATSSATQVNINFASIGTGAQYASVTFMYELD